MGFYYFANIFSMAISD